MSDGLTDSRREAAIQQKFDHGLALLEEALDDGGHDYARGINGSLVRSLNNVFRKRGYELRAYIASGPASKKS